MPKIVRRDLHRPVRQPLTGPLVVTFAGGALALATLVGVAGQGPASAVDAAAHTTRVADAVAPAAGRPDAVLPPRAKPAKPVHKVSRSVHRAAPARPAWVRPAGGAFSSGFGMRWGRMHQGIDLAAAPGSPVRAAGDGVIIFAGWDTGYGRRIMVRHAGGIVTTYNHMSAFVRTGGSVRAGDVIGAVGSTGHSTGPHLHFEVLVGGQAINPVPFLTQRGVRI